MFIGTNDRTYSLEGRQLVLWEELATGAPTIIGFARLCSDALAANRAAPVEPLSAEAHVILYAARRGGAIEVKGVNDAFKSAERFLAVCVELDADRQLICRRPDEPQLTLRFLDSFRQMCASGLVMHHIFREFSLTRAGFDLASSIQRQELPLLDLLAEDQLLGEV
jgi:hypothetical protein